VPDAPPPSYPVAGEPFGAKPPKAHGRADQPWGRKTFDEITLPDRRVRTALIWLQDLTNAIARVQELEQMPPDELARRAGVSLTNLQAVLRGDHAPSWETFTALLTVLDMRLVVDPDEEHRPRIEEEPGREPWWRGKRRRRPPAG
jgi:DNA-binding phage protein